SVSIMLVAVIYRVSHVSTLFPYTTLFRSRATSKRLTVRITCAIPLISIVIGRASRDSLLLRCREPLQVCNRVNGNPLFDDPPYPPIGKAGKASDPDAATARPFDQIDPGENRFTAGDDIID